MQLSPQPLHVIPLGDNNEIVWEVLLRIPATTGSQYIVYRCYAIPVNLKLESVQYPYKVPCKVLQPYRNISTSIVTLVYM